ncbi:ATP-binding protein [Paraburkholderia panacisoli]|uniref:ATP-binding protein n=1 Tax=Paraburkholderia panacisoli TaxID=2603818 RepID=UPI00165FB5EA|nr:ATP-binding protein [Paraburkholderia panacisoli]
MLLIAVALNAYATGPWRVVILVGTDPTLPAAMLQIVAIRGALEAAAPVGAELYVDPLDGVRFGGEALMPEFLALIKKKYSQEQTDLVIGLGDYAANFAARYHTQIWPGTPVLISSFTEEWLRTHPVPAEFSSIPLPIDVDGTLAIAETLQPGARRLIVVGGATDDDHRAVQHAVDVARRRTSRVWSVETWQGLPLPELRQRLASLDRNAAVAYTTMYRDREGRAYFPYEVVGPMAEVSRAPIYGWYSSYIAHGLTAGSTVTFESNGQRTGALATSILRGEVAPAGASLPAAAPRCTANVGQIEKLGMSISALPGDCLLVNVPHSIWREYRGVVLTALSVVIMQAFTIAALLVQRRRRRVAEDEATRRRSELARAARFASVGELSASIAHEVGQPLGAILSNTDAAELLLKSQWAEASELHEIFADVRRDALRANEVVQRLRALLQKQAVAFGPVRLDAALKDMLVLVAPEARRRGVIVESDFAAGSTEILGDKVQLEQVLLNLTINAMDAMHDVAPSRRVLSISTRLVTDGIELAVADRGHGISADAATQLFEAFYTTKPHGMGLGLSIVRSIVDAHDGRLAAAPREGGGSIFTVWLPARHATIDKRNLAAAGDTTAETAPDAVCHAAEGRDP